MALSSRMEQGVRGAARRSELYALYISLSGTQDEGSRFYTLNNCKE